MEVKSSWRRSVDPAPKRKRFTDMDLDFDWIVKRRRRRLDPAPKWKRFTDMDMDYEWTLFSVTKFIKMINKWRKRKKYRDMCICCYFTVYVFII